MPENPPAPYRLRDAEAKDCAAIAPLYAHYVLNTLVTFEEIPPAAEEMARRLQAVQAAGLPWLVAEAEGGILGYAYARPYHDRSAYRFTVENSVYLAPAHFRRGIGLALMGELIAACSARGRRQMMAVIGDGANQNSIGLHRRLGFRAVGELRSVGFKFGRWVDVMLMQRELGSGAGP